MNSSILEISFWWISSSASARMSLKIDRPCRRAICVASNEVPKLTLLLLLLLEQSLYRHVY